MTKINHVSMFVHDSHVLLLLQPQQQPVLDQTLPVFRRDVLVPPRRVERDEVLIDTEDTGNLSHLRAQPRAISYERMFK
jgi:hypothetical protein